MELFSEETDLDRAANFGNFRVQAFASQADFDSYIKAEGYGFDSDKPGVCFGFEIHENSESDYELELMFNDVDPGFTRAIPNQKLSAVDPTGQKPNLYEYSHYLLDGYSNMQNWVANAILKRKTGVDDASIATVMTPFPIEPVMTDAFATILSKALDFFMLLMYIPVMYRTVYRVVSEKTSRAKELMRMMGLSDLPYWLSWYV
jgi:hypothetical protein